jgi:protein gp37
VVKENIDRVSEGQMGDKTGISWTNSTWNPIVGCSIVSPACTNCYAMAQAGRIERMHPNSHYAGTTQSVRGHKAVWTGLLKQAPGHILLQPLHWKKPRRIFVNSMSDLFHENVPDEWIDRIFAVMALAPRHTFQILTKRPARMRAYCSGDRREEIFYAAVDLATAYEISFDWPLRNVWLGVTAEDQTRADERIPDLLATPAAKRFVSVEPMLGPVDLTDIPWPADRPRFPDTDDLSDSRSALHLIDGARLDWVIVGGESGPGARPMHPAWARSLRDQCKAAGVPYFFKQRGEWSWMEDPMSPTFDEENETTPELPSDWRTQDRNVICMRSDGTRVDGYGGGDEEFLFRVGKARAGDRLDGLEHKEFPACGSPSR